MKNIKLLDKAERHTPDMIFGILCGGGLFLVVSAITDLINRLFSVLESYSLILFLVIYILLLMGTSKLAKKGWFNLTYIITALLLLIRYLSIYTGILGVI